ncbi:DsbA family protein [Amycolatopsis sp. GA6-003]|uniref:DsbA family protein n=1 Tax=Amycolatopsis sp. GA6-003 TaxID=2652444 RepID=UPI0039170FF6
MTQQALAPRHRPPLPRKRKLLTAGLIALVVAAVVGGGLFLQLRTTAAEADGYGPARTPARITGSAVVTLGPANAPHAVDVYEDPLCPYCSQFEQRFGQLLAKAADEGKARVNYHILTFLDEKSASRSYSTRAASTLLCAVQSNGAAFGPLHDRLMATGTQPKENASADLTDEELARFAGEAGAGPGVEACLRAGTHARVLRDTTAAVHPTIPGTPTVRIDGRLVPRDELPGGDWADPLR